MLEGLDPQRVFYYFEEICKIPHGSRNTKQISDYLVGFAKDHKLTYRQDEANNVIIWKEASPGAEKSPVVMLQGHMDMVCEKEDQVEIDFEKEGLSLEVEDGMIHAKGTTLGGDDGIALAFALAILEDSDLIHPPIEAVFTVDEEIGLLGATALDTSDLKSEILLNLDSEEEGHFLTGCAGGVTAMCHLPVQREERKGIFGELIIDGLKGGHSGMEIDKGRANAGNLLGRVLYDLSRRGEFDLINVMGGLKDNAIIRMAKAELLIDPEEVSALQEGVGELQAILEKEYQMTDPQVRVKLLVEGEKSALVLTKASKKALISSIINAPRGVQRMSYAVEGLVQSSLNLGILKMEEGEAFLSYSVRSSIESEKKEMLMRLSLLMEILGGSLKLEGDYPGWEYRKDSRVRDVMVEVFQKQYGTSPVIETMHAGVECGIFLGKMPTLDCISYGPNLLDIHTPKERMDIESVKRTWNLTKEVLKRLAS